MSYEARTELWGWERCIFKGVTGMLLSVIVVEYQGESWRFLSKDSDVICSKRKEVAYILEFR